MDDYPATISQDQLYKICHISKRKATWLLENGYIPCEDTGKKTHRFKIRITDVIAYLTQLEDSPTPLLPPPGIFSSGINDNPKHKSADQIDSEKFIAILKIKWSGFPDALTASDVTRLVGYSQSTISQWILTGKIIGVKYYSKHQIPKDCLIEYIATKSNYEIHQKSNKHMVLIEQYRNLQTGLKLDENTAHR